MSTETRMKVVCHEGTGTGVVAGALRNRGMDLYVVRNRETAHYTQFDALILLGGADVHPFWYGQDVTFGYGFDRKRDIIEWTLLRRALAMNVPIMGICRGHQMINVVCGGTLYQDMEQEEVVGRAGHGFRHSLKHIDPRLDAYLPSHSVNSLHHQAVRQVAPGFEVLAYSDDGVVESIWREGILGVQFHPELMLSQEAGWGRIFDWFAAGLGEQAARRAYRRRKDGQLALPMFKKDKPAVPTGEPSVERTAQEG